MYNILFICTGNTCRSPMAAALAQDILNREGVEAFVDSAGVSVPFPFPATDNAVAVLREYGLEVSGHQARKYTPEDLEKADIILTMTERHQDYLIMQEKKYEGKIYTLGAYVGQSGEDIDDPYGGNMLVYRKCAKHMEDLIRKLALKLNGNGKEL